MADFNGDGLPDTAAGNMGIGAAITPGNIDLLLNQGLGTVGELRSFESPAGPGNVFATADFDGDGDLDIAYPSGPKGPMPGSMVLFRNDGHGTLAPEILAIPDFSLYRGAAVGDLDGDGDADLVVTLDGPPYILLLLNDGAGTFTSQRLEQVSSQILIVAIHDFDGDGKRDLFLGMGDMPTSQLLLGDGAGGFRTMLEVPAKRVYNVDVNDLDLDGTPDLVVSSGDDPATSVYLNTGGGTFRAASAFTELFDCRAADMSGDCVVDLVCRGITTSSPPSSFVRVLVNDGHGRFTSRTDVSVPVYRLALGDLDNDGDTDVVTSATSPGAIYVLLSELVR